MVSRMKIYTVHSKPEDRGAQHNPVFVKEGFNFIAAALPLLWMLYKRLWVPAVLILLFNLSFLWFMKGSILSHTSLSALDLAFRVLVGFHANDWLRTYLRKNGYIMADISAADSLLRAEQRYLERYLAAAPAK